MIGFTGICHTSSTFMMHICTSALNKDLPKELKMDLKGATMKFENLPSLLLSY